MPEPVKALKVPPMTSMSPRLKSLLFSLRVKVMVAVWPSIRLVLSLVTAMVGTALSTLVVS